MGLMEVAGLTIGVANLISASTESLDRVEKLFKASNPPKKYGGVTDSILAELALLGTFHTKYTSFLIKGDEDLRFSIFQLLGQQENVLNEMEFRYRKDQGHAIDFKDQCFYRSSWKTLARTKQTSSLSVEELFRILKGNNLQLKTVTILLESTSSSDNLRVRIHELGLQNSLLSQIVTICLEALRLCEAIYDSVFEEDRIRLHAWARDTGMQEGILDKVIVKEDEIRVTLYALFGNISLVICSALKPELESNESNEGCSKVTDPRHQRHAENLWVELRLLADQAKKEVEDFDMYSLCEVGEVLPIEEVMQELPGLVDELFGMSRALEQLFSEHSHEQNDEGCLRVVSNIVQGRKVQKRYSQKESSEETLLLVNAKIESIKFTLFNLLVGMEEESHAEGLEQCIAKLGVESPSPAGYPSGIELQIPPPTPTSPVNYTRGLPYLSAEDHLEIKNSDFSKEPTVSTTSKIFRKGGEIDLRSRIRNASSEAPTQGVTIFDKILTVCRWVCEIFRPGQGTIETDDFGQQCIKLHYWLLNTPMAQLEGLPHKGIAVSSIDVNVLLQLALVGVSNVLVKAVECECSTITITKEEESCFGNRGTLEDVKMVGGHLETLVDEALYDYPKMKRFVRRYGLETGLSLLTSDLKAFNIVLLAAQKFASPPIYKTPANPQLPASHKKALGLWTALQAAAEGKNSDIVKLLLDHGFRVEAVLQAAAIRGHLGIVQLLLDNNADVNARDSYRGGQTALQAAAGAGHIDIVKLLLDNNADVNVKTNNYGGTTALQAAARGGYIDIVKLLLDNGADVNTQASYYKGLTALQAAAEGGHTDIVKLLLDSKANVNAEAASDSGRTALQAAAGGRHIDTVKLLLDNKAEVNAQVSLYNGETPLRAAVRSGDIGVVKLLLEHSATVNTESVYGIHRTALQAAAEIGNISIVKLLLDNKADVNAKANTHEGRTALQAAAEGGHTDIVKLLLDANAKVNAKAAPGSGRTALQAAAGGGHIDAVKLLLENNADVNAEASSYKGRTALQAAAEKGHIDIVRLLLRTGADINAGAASDNGFTALEAAAGGGHINIVNLLLDNNANVYAEAKSYEGRTALQAAAERGYFDIAKLLLNRGAEVNAEAGPRKGLIALQAAAACGHIEIVKLLLESGANVNAAATTGSCRTALQAAAASGHIGIVKLLLNNGANVHVGTGSGLLQLSSRHWHPDIKKLLVDAGAEYLSSRSAPIPGMERSPRHTKPGNPPPRQTKIQVS